jgi:hypothetical protein
MRCHHLGIRELKAMTEEEIEIHGLKHVIPKRRQGVRGLRKITVRYLQNNKNNSKLTRGILPGVRQKRTMLALAVSLGVQICIANYTNRVGHHSPPSRRWVNWPGVNRCCLQTVHDALGQTLRQKGKKGRNQNVQAVCRRI